MTIRPTMFELVRVLRGMTGAGTADYTVRNDPYWTDEQLQVVLDNYRTDIHMEPLSLINTYVGGGSVSYLYYQSGV